MPVRISHFFLAIVIYLAICILASLAINPFSIINYVGPAAGVAAALMLLWGPSILLAVFIGTLLFNFFLFVYLDYQVDLSITVISFLAISLQAFWTRQLSFKYINDQQWLNSRAMLFAFLAKIGPLAGVVSASATVLVAVLDAKILAGSLIYAFFSSWAGSILTAIFITPSLLFTRGQQKLTVLKRLFVIIASTLGFIAIVLLFVFSQKSNQHQRIDRFSSAKTLLTQSVDKKVSQIDFQVKALSALLSSSEQVSEKEFLAFAKQIYLPQSTVRALEWIPAVTAQNRAAFEQFASNELKLSYNVSELSSMGDIVSALPRALYFPVLYAYPKKNNLSAFGIDLFIHSDKFEAMNQAQRQSKVVASAPVNLVQDDFSNPGLLMFYPVYNNHSVNHFGEQRSSNFVISGYVLAVVQFDSLFQKLAMQLQEKNYEFSLLDITNASPYILFGKEADYKNRLVEHINIDVFSRQWQVTVYESQPWDVQEKSWQTWGLLAGGCFGGIIFQVLILMMAAYSTELSNQVTLKTRELILAKEQADQSNLAKTKFLSTLAVEFKSPLQAILVFLESYKQRKLPEVTQNAFASLKNASQSIEHLVEHLQDLNSIESGKLTLNSYQIDLHDFIHQTEARLKNTAKLYDKMVKVLLGKNVPQFVEVDEFRLQQLLTIVTDNAYALLQTDVLRVSVKAHLHKLASTSLFFVLTADETLISEQNNLFIFDDSNNELERHSTAMAMVKELSQLLGGNAKIVNLPSGNPVISVSITAHLPSVRKTHKPPVEHNHYRDMLISKDVLLVSCDKALIAELTALFSQLDRRLDILSNQQDVFKSLNQSQYKLMIIDGDDTRINAVRVAEKIRQSDGNDGLNIIGMFGGQLSQEYLLTIKTSMNGYLDKPININKLKYYLAQNA